MPGPAPMPTRLKILTGNRGGRPLNEQEPQPDVVIPTKPQVLQGVAATEWKRITKELARLGLVTEIDKTALAAYCQMYERWTKAEKAIRKDGMIVFSDNGYPNISPYVSISNKALDCMKKFLIEFGMTPASRSRVKGNPPEKSGNEFDEI